MITNNGLKLFSLIIWRYRYRVSMITFKTTGGYSQNLGSMNYSMFGTSPSSSTTTLPFAYNMNIPNNDTSNASSSLTGAYPIICVGNGTTPPTKEDYKLESCLTDLSVGNMEFSILDTGKCNISRNFINNTSTDLTINEIGLYIKGNTNNDYTSMSVCIMIARKVLDTPIVIGAGQTATVNYTLDFTNLED